MFGMLWRVVAPERLPGANKLFGKTNAPQLRPDRRAKREDLALSSTGNQQEAVPIDTGSNLSKIDF
jgi:hypothetical protein